MRHERLCANERLSADDRAVENDRAHSHEDFIAERAGVDDGGMADGDVIADQAWEIVREMKDGVVLDIGMVSDDDAIDVAAHDGVIPDARTGPELYIPKHGGATCDVNALAEFRFFAQETVELLFEFGHGLVSS